METRLHPLLAEYLNEVGFLRPNPEMGDSGIVPSPLADPDELVREGLVTERVAAAMKAPEPVTSEGAKGQPVAQVWVGGSLDDQEAMRRTRLGSYVGQLNTQAALVYEAVVEHLQPWLQRHKGLDAETALRQAREVARHHLPSSVSVE
jgi:hypothetical protein